MSSAEHVVIAGAGPVGLSAALLLADAGVPVTVVERRPELASASKASTFHPATLAILDAMGVFEPLRGRGQIVDRIQYRTAADGIFAEFALEVLGKETKFPYRLHLEQAQLTPVLLERLLAHPHARARFGAELVGFEQDDDRVIARVQRDGAEERIEAAYLIGADGSRSDVRRLAGISFEGVDYPDRVLRVMTTDDLGALLPGIAPVTYLFNQGKSASFLRMSDCWRIILRVPREADDATALDPEWILARLREVIPHAKRLPTVLMKDVYGVGRRVAGTYRSGRVLLMGDSAHITNTRGGMNMNCGIHDAWVITRALADGLNGAGRGVVDAAADERHRVAIEMLIPRTDRNVAGGDAWLDRVREMAADPAKQLGHLRASGMLDMVPPPAR